jgi:hypothetical protein
MQNVLNNHCNLSKVRDHFSDISSGVTDSIFEPVSPPNLSECFVMLKVHFIHGENLVNHRMHKKLKIYTIPFSVYCAFFVILNRRSLGSVFSSDQNESFTRSHGVQVPRRAQPLRPRASARAIAHVSPASCQPPCLRASV